MTHLNPQVAIAGAGTMGSAIAQVFAASGIPVTLIDPDDAALQAVPARLSAGCAAVGRDAAPVLELVAVTRALEEAVAKAELVIECGPEDLELKRALLSQIESATGQDTLLASNTSAIPITLLAEPLARPDKFVGTHFWNPPSLLPVVEVVRGANTSTQTVEATADILQGVGLTAVPVSADIPGFIGNRLQHALKREAIALVRKGLCTPEVIDSVVRLGFGRRLALLGPLEQSDLNGLDLTLAIHQVLIADLDTTPGPDPLLEELVGRGDLGAKTGKGFYSWTPERAKQRQEEVASGLAGWFA